MNKILIQLFERDLRKLKDEVSFYPDESQLWLVEKDIKNSAGNLVLHLVGNLNHFIGATLGNTGYVRNRENEFALKNIPRPEMLDQIDKTIVVVKNTLSKMPPSDFENIYPLPVQNGEVTTGFFLVNLAAHLNYHLGQINYHRRLLAV